jgi:chromosome segregation ATPase
MAKWLIPQEKTMSDVDETKEQKINAMLAIRKLVKDHITGKEKSNVPYLAKLELDKEDNTRLVIALQDMVDDERGRHARARGHIVKLKDIMEKLKVSYAQITNAAHDLDNRLEEAINQIRKLQHQLAKAQAQLIDKDRQIQTLLELAIGDRNPPIQETAPATMGNSNCDSGRWLGATTLDKKGTK